MRNHEIHDVRILDIVTLRRLIKAEDSNAPLAPAFVDTLVRLSDASFIKGDDARGLRVTDSGRSFLRFWDERQKTEKLIDQDGKHSPLLSQSVTPLGATLSH